jgi:aldose 1-epimerase
VIERREASVTGQFQLSVDAPDRMSQWPSDFQIEVDYELIGGRLRANFRIQNPCKEDLPWGLGTHPYFKAPFTSDGRWEDCLVEVPVSEMWVLNDCLPNGRTVEPPEEMALADGAFVSTLQLDDVYTGVISSGPQFDMTLIDEGTGLQIVQTCPPIFREVVVYTPPNRRAICVEPYTCPTDAIHLSEAGHDVGWRVLSPGSEFHTWIDLSVSRMMS